MKKVVKILRGIGYLLAFSLILYPVVSNYINQMNSTTIATDYEQEVSHLSEDQENAMIKQAQEYNESLIGIGSIADPFSESNENQTEDDEYNKLLKIDDTGMMGYIDIPKLDVVLPVYHGTSEKVLQSGVGHLKNTSLPVGGESCHAVLSGHRGLANAKIFTDLNKMEVGDVFYIKVLHHTFAYQVDQILTVLPSDTDSLQIEKGKDYVTLVTCTPYAVNTHRLLVRGTRIPYEEAQKVDEEVGLQRTIPFNLILLIAGIIALIIIWVSIKLYKRRKEKNMSRISKRKRIYMCMASVMCMLLLLIPLPVSANDLGSILLKATVEDETTVYKLSNTEFTMYQVGTYKNNSWALVSEFVKSGVIFDFDDSSAQAEAAKKLEKYVQDNNIKGMPGKTNSDGEVMYRDLEKGVYLFVQTQKTQISNQVYQSEPFIITVPGNYDDQIIWNVTAEPKFKNESIPPITTNTPPVSEEPSGDNSSHTSNVKTGDDTNVIMWLSLMGISLVIFSICKRKVHK